MNCASTKAPGRRAVSSRGGFTLIELLIALAIASAFLTGLYTAFSKILRAHDHAEARLEALRNARTAITTISDEFKGINSLGSDYLLIGLDQPLTYGDGIDSDADGNLEPRPVDGQPGALPGSDRHAMIGSHTERPLYVGRPDEGDTEIDTDARFSHDSIVLRIFPRVPTPELTLKTVTYNIESYDGQPNVLVRRSRIERTGSEPLVGVAPLAFDVLSFDILYWNPNAPPQQQYWVTTWDSTQAANFDPPRLPLPASLYIRLTLNADDRPHASIQPGAPVETVLLESIVNVEQTIGDALYPRPDL